MFGLLHHIISVINFAYVPHYFTVSCHVFLLINALIYLSVGPFNSLSTSKKVMVRLVYTLASPNFILWNFSGLVVVVIFKIRISSNT